MAANFRMFQNQFDDRNITPSRFLDFCMFSYDAMSANNKDGRYDKELVVVNAIIGTVDDEINGVDTNLHTQVNNTSDVKRFMKKFGRFMMRNNGSISYALGGDESAAFQEFYPYRNEEYLSANRATTPKLTARVSTLAAKYAEQLGPKLTADLQAFMPEYKKVLSAQRRQITNVNQNRADRNTVVEDAQWQMTGVILSVATMNLRNPAASENLFPFHTLYPQTKEQSLKLKGSLAAGEAKELMNRTLTAEVRMGIRNNSVNADIMVWLAASPADAAPKTGIVIPANKKIVTTAGKLGDLTGTFLMVKNMSDVNSAAYVISVIGIKKEGDKEEGNIKSISLKIAS